MLRFDWRSCFFHFPRLATRSGLFIADEQQARDRFRPEADVRTDRNNNARFNAGIGRWV